MKKILKFKIDPATRARFSNALKAFWAKILTLENRIKMLQGFLSAAQFLTIFPLRSKQSFNARAALAYFPICGLAVGTTVVVVDAVATLFWPVHLVALIDVIALAVISGALHLDGLADTADGMFSHKAPDQALSIMKDSRVGAMGVVALIFTLLLKWVALAHIASHYKMWLLLAPAYARASVLFGTKFLPYGRSEGGTGEDFFKEPLKITDFWGFGLLVPLSLLMSWQCIALNIGFLVIVFTVLWWYRRKFNGITGDMFGALFELTETGLFLIAASYLAA